jgi:hypothetical protein
MTITADSLDIHIHTPLYGTRRDYGSGSSGQQDAGCACGVRIVEIWDHNACGVHKWIPEAPYFANGCRLPVVAPAGLDEGEEHFCGSTDCDGGCQERTVEQFDRGQM